MQHRRILSVLATGMAMFFAGLVFASGPAAGQSNGASKIVHILYSSSSHGYFDTCG